MKKIAVLTSGGDSPGMNAAIRSVARTALNYKMSVCGVRYGYAGLIQADFIKLDSRSVSNIVGRGGTILKTARSKEFKTKEGRARAIQNMRSARIEGLIVIGGDGTYRGAIEFNKEGNLPVIGIPGTIDNDVWGTDYTLGADTALNTALEAIDHIRDTATSMERIFVVEVMGRESGYIAAQVALAGGAECALVPEEKFDIDQMAEDIVEGNIRGKVSWIIVAAEGAIKGEKLRNLIQDKTGLDIRLTVLGHIQRGGAPTAMDRILGARFGARAVELLRDGESAKAVGIVHDEVVTVSLKEAVGKKDTRFLKNLSLIKILT